MCQGVWLVTEEGLVSFRAETLAEPKNRRSRQAAGTVHVHPDGRFLYGANRAQDTMDYQGKKVFKGGENSIVVYSIDQSTGEATPIQHVETRAIHPRTFHIDPSGRMLVAQHNPSMDVRDGDAVRTTYDQRRARAHLAFKGTIAVRAGDAPVPRRKRAAAPDMWLEH